jgi:hypothetical protein
VPAWTRIQKWYELSAKLVAEQRASGRFPLLSWGEVLKEEDQDKCGGPERRREPRGLAEKYVSVEFCLGPLDPVFLFRIRDESASGLGILVKEGSEALKHLRVGNVLNIICRGPRTFESLAHMKARVMHITKNDDGQFKGHYLVGLAIIEGQLHD